MTLDRLTGSINHGPDSTFINLYDRDHLTVTFLLLRFTVTYLLTYLLTY